MEFLYRPTEYEFKLIALYIVKNLELNVTGTMVDYVANGVINTDYFELQGYLQNLVKEKKLDEYIIEGENVYVINKSGEEILGFFENDIPFSTREKLDGNMREFTKKTTYENDITADIYPVTDDEYAAKCVIKENKAMLMSLEINAGSKDAAKEVAARFKENPMELYNRVLKAVNEFKKQ